ncbi:hypothetical protein V2G26_016666 [Clonostachys chloroleuca]
MNTSAITSYQHISRSESNQRRWMPVGSHVDIDISVELPHPWEVRQRSTSWWRGHGFCEADYESFTAEGKKRGSRLTMSRLKVVSNEDVTNLDGLGMAQS